MDWLRHKAILVSLKWSTRPKFRPKTTIHILIKCIQIKLIVLPKVVFPRITLLSLIVPLSEFSLMDSENNRDNNYSIKYRFKISLGAWAWNLHSCYLCTFVSFHNLLRIYAEVKTWKNSTLFLLIRLCLFIWLFFYKNNIFIISPMHDFKFFNLKEYLWYL